MTGWDWVSLCAVPPVAAAASWAGYHLADLIGRIMGPYPVDKLGANQATSTTTEDPV